MDAWGLSGGRPVTVAADETLTIRLPHKLVAAIDSYARALEMTRSKAIRMLLERSAASPNRRTRLKQRDRRIAELKRDLDKANALVEEMREQVQDGFDLIASWIEAFGMKLADDGKWYYDDWVMSCIKFPRQINSPPQGLEQVRSRLQRHRGPAPRNDLPALRNCNTVWRCASLAASVGPRCVSPRKLRSASTRSAPSLTKMPEPTAPRAGTSSASIVTWPLGKR
jgi:hypothetical protein